MITPPLNRGKFPVSLISATVYTVCTATTFVEDSRFLVCAVCVGARSSTSFRIFLALLISQDNS